MVRIYIAGPYTQGDTAVNVKNAISTANELADLGYAPYVPHFTHFWHMMFPRPYEFWLELDNQYLTCCDGVLRLPGESNGADKEVELAISLDLPIFYSIEEVQSYVLSKPNVNTYSVNELGSILASMYNTAKEDEKVTMIHLFGVKYAKQIRSVGIREVVEVSGIHESYRTEINKAVKLSKYVTASP